MMKKINKTLLFIFCLFFLTCNIRAESLKSLKAQLAKDEANQAALVKKQKNVQNKIKSANKEILLFVLTPPNESDETNEIKARQAEFRNYILSSNCLQKFSSLEELKKFSHEGLLKCISSK